MIKDNTPPQPTGEWNSTTDLITKTMTAEEVARFCTSFVSTIKLIQHRHGQTGAFGIISSLHDIFGSFLALVKDRVANGQPVDELEGPAILNVKASCMAAAMYLCGDELFDLAKLGNTGFETIVHAHNERPDELIGAIALIVRRNEDGSTSMAVTVEEHSAFLEKVKLAGADKAINKTLGTEPTKSQKPKRKPRAKKVPPALPPEEAK